MIRIGDFGGYVEPGRVGPSRQTEHQAFTDSIRVNQQYFERYIFRSKRRFVHIHAHMVRKTVVRLDDNDVVDRQRRS